ncbi:hypothetical protein [Kutzneria sp. NPDC052558]|uniref:hypothetical protein n=1 Tax=Kutzneria sp. NPDC052558 TaxID=3364121 RepID=UPI0037CB1B82
MTADLAPSEQVLWTGSPVRRSVFDASDRLVLPGAALAVVFMVFWISTAVGSGAPVFFVGFGVVGMAWFLYLLIGRPAVRWLELRATTYTVTNQRVLIESTVFGRRRAHSRYYRQLSPPTVFDRGGGIGDVRFEDPGVLDMMRASRNRSIPPRPFELRAIEDPRRVRDLIMAQR